MNPATEASENSALTPCLTSNITKTVEVAFEEQSKAVVAKVSVRDTIPTSQDSTPVLLEAQKLFEQAHKRALELTFMKNR